MAPAAHWASWADALRMARLSALAQSIVVQLEAAGRLVGCLRLTRSRKHVGQTWFRPWEALQEGVRQTLVTDVEPSEWTHGQQHVFLHNNTGRSS